MFDDIKVTPIAGWATQTLPERKLLLDVDVFSHQEAVQTIRRAQYRVTMTADQARELALTLLVAASATEMGQVGIRARN